MIASPVVVEVLLDDELIIYEPSEFDLDDAAQFLHRYDLSSNRHFFLAEVDLNPLKETPAP